MEDGRGEGDIGRGAREQWVEVHGGPWPRRQLADELEGWQMRTKLARIQPREAAASPRTRVRLLPKQAKNERVYTHDRNVSHTAETVGAALTPATPWCRPRRDSSLRTVGARRGGVGGEGRGHAHLQILGTGHGGNRPRARPHVKDLWILRGAAPPPQNRTHAVQGGNSISNARCVCAARWILVARCTQLVHAGFPHALVHTQPKWR